MAGKYFSLHHRFLSWIGSITNTIILLPHPESIGNACEDYYFGLLKARREGKKLVVLFPFQLPWHFKIRMFDPALLFLESDLLFTRFGSPVSSLLRGIFTLYWLPTRAMVIFLVKYFSLKATGYYWRPLAGQDILWRPDASQIKFDWTLARDQDWETQLSVPLELSLPGNIVSECEIECDRMGLPRDAWFVCLHVREGGYKGDWDNIRNADIDNYLSAIKEITLRGGWVIRMGDPTMTNLPVLDKVIDYAHSPIRSATMDVFLMTNCTFFVGTSTGISEMPLLLGTPTVKTNLTQWINEEPMKLGDLAIFKHVFSRSDKRFISIQEWLQRASTITKDHWSSPDWELIENSREEIASVVTEFMDSNREKNRTPIQELFREGHTRAIRVLSETLHFDSTEVENCNDWYRFALRMLAWRGEVSAEFLEKNWIKNSRKPN